jgi:hypothetical protein
MEHFVWQTQSLQCLLHLSSGQCKVASKGLLEATQSTGEEELCQVRSNSDEEQTETKESCESKMRLNMLRLWQCKMV